MPLLFHSTNRQSPGVDLREAFLRGQAPDRGLYFPETFPVLAPEEIAAFADLPYAEIAFRVLSRYTDGILPAEVLSGFCREAYDFDIPLETVYDRVVVMRLDQGPTASFKDFAARMMVSVPTVMNLEKGSPVVGIGILIRALSVLGLEKNFAAIAAPERDEAGMALEMRRLKSIGARNPMAETDLDF